eukprot:139132_1
MHLSMLPIRCICIWIYIFHIRYYMCIKDATISENNALYWSGNAPLIILSQVDGDLAPSSIPNRINGCIDPNDSNNCLYGTDCTNYNPLPLTPSPTCTVYTSNWAYTKEISQCLYEKINITKSDGSSLGKPYLIINNLKRIKLDSDREIEEGAQNNLEAEITWNQIHKTFYNIATNEIKNEQNCGFGGLLIDITGHSYTEKIHFRYKLTKSDINSDNKVLNDKLYLTSIKKLIQGKNKNNESVTTAIHGNYSLSQIHFALFENLYFVVSTCSMCEALLTNA